MNISGIRPGHGFYSYNVVKINQLRNQQIAAAKQIQMNSRMMRQVLIQRMPGKGRHFLHMIMQRHTARIWSMNLSEETVISTVLMRLNL